MGKAEEVDVRAVPQAARPQHDRRVRHRPRRLSAAPRRRTARSCSSRPRRRRAPPRSSPPTAPPRPRPSTSPARSPPSGVPSVRVNCVSPGLIRTEGSMHAVFRGSEELVAKAGRTTAVGRIGEPGRHRLRLPLPPQRGGGLRLGRHAGRRRRAHRGPHAADPARAAGLSRLEPHPLPPRSHPVRRAARREILAPTDTATGGHDGRPQRDRAALRRLRLADGHPRVAGARHRLHRRTRPS